MKKTITIALVALLSFNVSAKGKDTHLTFNQSSVDNNSTFALRPAKRGDGDGIKGKIMITAGVGLNLFKTNLAVRYALSTVYATASYVPTWKQTPMINAAVDYGLGKKFP